MIDLVPWYTTRPVLEKYVVQALLASRSRILNENASPTASAVVLKRMLWPALACAARHPGPMLWRSRRSLSRCSRCARAAGSTAGVARRAGGRDALPAWVATASATIDAAPATPFNSKDAPVVEYVVFVLYTVT